MTHKIFPYSWHIDEKQEERTVIRIYGLNIKNQSICVTINDFTPYIYLELPDDIEWNEVRANMLGKKIDNICGKFRPLKKCLCGAHRKTSQNHFSKTFLISYKLNRLYILLKNTYHL